MATRGKPQSKSPSWDDMDRFTGKHFHPYTQAIGQAALAWNHLHEELGRLFADLLFQGDLTGNAVWQSSNTDRAKRKMLGAGVKELNPKYIPQRVIDEVLWILGKSEALEDTRNDTVHAPLLSYDHPLWQEIVDPDLKGIRPNETFGNVRATKLGKKDLLSEYRYCRDVAVVLGKYAEAICDWSQKEPFPNRPRLPSRGQKKGRRGRLSPRNGPGKSSEKVDEPDLFASKGKRQR